MEQSRRRRDVIPRTVALRTTRPERKTADVTGLTGSGLVVDAISTTPAINTLNQLFLGTEVYNRVGRKIRMHSLQIRGTIIADSSTPATDWIRIVVVYDRQGDTTGTPPTWGDVFASQNLSGLVTTLPWDYMNSSNFERFQILADDEYSLNNAPTAAVNVATNLTDFTQKIMYKKYIKLKNLTSHYGQVGVSASRPTTGAIYLMTLGVNPLATNPYAFAWNARLRFDDY